MTCPQPARLQAIIIELCNFLRDLVAGELDEILDNTRMEVGSPQLGAPELLAMAAGARGGSARYRPP